MSDGINARRLLTDDAFLKAVERTRDTYTEQWRLSKSQEQRERLHIAVNLLDEVVDHLAGFMEGDDVDKKVEKLFKDKRFYNFY